MRAAAATLLVSSALVLGGCGEDEPPPVASAYDRMLTTASEVVDCRTPGDDGVSGEDVYSEGSTADSAAAAIETGSGEGLFSGVQEGLAVARTEPDRVLYVVEVDGVVKQAVIVRDGPATSGAGGPGWYVESWAVCDFSELPRDFTDSIGLQVWSDAAGTVVPTTEIKGWRGPEHCDWQSMTFLNVGDEMFIREPKDEFEELVTGPYREHVDVPTDAKDTGYRRDGDQLWVSSDGDTAYVGTEDDAEAWPRATDGVGCA